MITKRKVEDIPLDELGKLIQGKPEILERVLPQDGEGKPIETVKVAAFQSSI